MNGKQVKRILYVEDEKALTDSFEEFVREDQDGLSGRWRVKLEIARCIADADRVLDTNGFDGLILDLMLPRLRADLRGLADLNQRRLELVREFFNLSNRRPGQAGTVQAEQLEQEMTEVRAQIVELDFQIGELINVNGGCEIAENLARKRDPQSIPPVLSLPVVFLTARGLPKAKERCGAVVEARSLRILEKPLPEEDVLRELFGLFDDLEGRQ